MKKGQVTIFVIIALLLAVSVGVVLFVSNGSPDIEVECQKNSDCVPADCCHATSCVAVGDAPSCDGVFCTEICSPGSLDCGQGSCGCVQGRCVAEIN